MARPSAAASRTCAVIVMPPSRLIIAAARLPWLPPPPAGSCMQKVSLGPSPSIRSLRSSKPNCWRTRILDHGPEIRPASVGAGHLRQLEDRVVSLRYIQRQDDEAVHPGGIDAGIAH